MVIGTKGESLSAGFRTKLEELFGGNRIVDFSAAMEMVRMVKTAEKIRRLKRATEIIVKFHGAFRAASISMLGQGADGVIFINVGCGSKTSYAAHAPSTTGQTISHGYFFKVDMGALCHGYGADFVRSYFVGTASERHHEIWKRMNEVQMEFQEVWKK